MQIELTYEELISLVDRIAESQGTEMEINNWIDLVNANVPHPSITDLIFHSDDELTPEQIVTKALAYKPIQL